MYMDRLMYSPFVCFFLKHTVILYAGTVGGMTYYSAGLEVTGRQGSLPPAPDTLDSAVLTPLM